MVFDKVEGGFVQGMGWLCTEELVWGDNDNPWIRKGHLHTCGPGDSRFTTVFCALLPSKKLLR